MPLSMPQNNGGLLSFETLLSLGLKMREQRAEEKRALAKAALDEQQLEITKRNAQLREQEYLTSVERLGFERDKAEREAETAERTVTETKASREALSEFLINRGEQDANARIKTLNIPSIEEVEAGLATTQTVAGQAQKQVSDIMTIRQESIAKANAMKAGAADYMQKVFGTDSAAAFFGFTKPALDLPKIMADGSGYVDLNPDTGKLDFFPFAREGESLTNEQKNAKAFAVAYKTLNTAMLAGSPISFDAEAETMKLAPNDSIREFIHLAALKSRVKNGVASQNEIREMRRIEDEQLLQGDKLFTVQYQDPTTGRTAAHIVSTKGILEGGDGVIAKVGTGGKLILPESSRAKMADTYSELSSGLPRLVDMTRDLNQKRKFLSLGQKAVNYSLALFAKVIDPNFDPENFDGEWGKLKGMIRDAKEAEAFYVAVNSFYQEEYRKPVTGAQAGIQELEELKQEFLSTDMAPWQFLAKAQAILSARVAKMRLLKTAIETGELPPIILDTKGYRLEPEELMRVMLGLDQKPKEK